MGGGSFGRLWYCWYSRSSDVNLWANSSSYLGRFSVVSAILQHMESRINAVGHGKVFNQVKHLKCGGKSNRNTATSPTRHSLDSIYQKEITQNTLFGPFSEHFYTTWIILTTVAIAYHILDYFDRNSRMWLDKEFDKQQPFVHFLCVAENLPRRKRLRFNGSWGAQSGAPESDYSSVIFRIKCNASGCIRLEDSPFTHKVYVSTLKTHIRNGIFKYSKYRAHLNHFPFLTFILLTPKSQTDYLNYVSTSFY